MDWKLFGVTFLTIFLAEMGDKTQLAAFNLTGSSQKPMIVFAAAASALIVVTGLGVLVGNLVAHYIPESTMKKIAAVLFVAIGVWTWFRG